MAPVRLTGQTAGQRSISDLHTLMTYIVTVLQTVCPLTVESDTIM